jgi:hypothetical protein
MRTSDPAQPLLFFILFVVGAVTTALGGYYSGFHVSGNDFWTLVFYGRQMSLAQPGSFYNGFYPFGYALLLGQLPYTYVVQLSYLINALLTGLFVASVATLVASARYLPAALAAVFASLLHPLAFQYSNTPGPDIGAAAFPALAVYLMWRDAFGKETAVCSRGTSAVIGLALGLGFLWRTHVIVFSGLALVLGVVFRRIRPGHPLLIMLAACLGIVSLQVAVDLLSGHRPFETAQMFNIYKLLYGLNWNQDPSPAAISGFSFWQVFSSQPQFVFDAVFPYLKHMLSFALPGAVCALLAPKGPLRSYAAFSTLVMALYAVPLSVSDSSRAPLAILPLHLSSLSLIVLAVSQRVRRHFPTRRFASMAAILLLAVFGVPALRDWGGFAWRFIDENRMTQRVFRGIDQVLLSNGMKSPDEVFSNKAQLYMPSRPPFTPRQYSEWYDDWVWGYAERYPPLPRDSWEAFRRSCLDQGIRFIVLSPLAGEQADFFVEIYEDQFDDDLVGLEFLAARANMRIYRFK